MKEARQKEWILMLPFMENSGKYKFTAAEHRSVVAWGLEWMGELMTKGHRKLFWGGMTDVFIFLIAVMVLWVCTCIQNNKVYTWSMYNCVSIVPYEAVVLFFKKKKNLNLKIKNKLKDIL